MLSVLLLLLISLYCKCKCPCDDEEVTTSTIATYLCVDRSKYDRLALSAFNGSGYNANLSYCLSNDSPNQKMYSCSSHLKSLEISHHQCNVVIHLTTAADTSNICPGPCLPAPNRDINLNIQVLFSCNNTEILCSYTRKMLCEQLQHITGHAISSAQLSQYMPIIFELLSQYMQSKNKSLVFVQRLIPSMNALNA